MGANGVGVGKVGNGEGRCVCREYTSFQNGKEQVSKHITPRE